MNNNKSRILVTGASGFIGDALCKKMALTGWHVRGTMRSAEQKVSFIDNLELIQINSIDADTEWSDVLTGVNTVVHLAARVHVTNDAESDPLSAFRQVNVAGTDRLARMAASHGIKRFVYISSIKVSGEANTLCEENDTPVPADPYGASKWNAEQVLRKVAAETGLELVIIRSPLVYGPGVKGNFLRLLEAVNRGIPLPLASIDNRRSLIYLGNLIDIIVTCIKHTKAAGQTYPVSDGDDVSTPELIRRVSKALGRPARLIHFPLFLIRLAGKLTGTTEAVNRLLGSLVIGSSKIRRELGWIPPYTMAQGLRETAVWYKKQL